MKINTWYKNPDQHVFSSPSPLACKVIENRSWYEGWFLNQRKRTSFRAEMIQVWRGHYTTAGGAPTSHIHFILSMETNDYDASTCSQEVTDPKEIQLYESKLADLKKQEAIREEEQRQAQIRHKQELNEALSKNEN